MTRVLRPFGYKDEDLIGYNAKCPGCNVWHSIYIKKNQFNKDIWSFDGNMEKPTFSPSLLVRWDHNNHVCHSFIRNGEWQFLNDCTHDLAGQTVPMIDSSYTT